MNVLILLLATVAVGMCIGPAVKYDRQHFPNKRGSK